MRGPLTYPVELSTHGDGCRGCTDARARTPSESISIRFCCVSQRSRPPDKWRLAAPRRRSAPRARPAPLLHGCPELELLVGHERSWSGVKVTTSRRWPTACSRIRRTASAIGEVLPDSGRKGAEPNVPPLSSLRACAGATSAQRHTLESASRGAAGRVRGVVSLASRLLFLLSRGEHGPPSRAPPYPLIYKALAFPLPSFLLSFFGILSSK